MTKSVLIVGSGPIGVEAALRVLAGHPSDADNKDSKKNNTFSVTILEQHGRLAGSVREWGHVQLFSPWKYNQSPLGASIVDKKADIDKCPTGNELVDEYLTPLVEYMKINFPERFSILFGTAVTDITRVHFGKTNGNSQVRSGDKFRVRCEPAESIHRTYDYVLDCSGCYSNPAPFGAGGVRAVGEETIGIDGVFYKIPDVLGKDSPRFANKTCLVIGGGFSAITTVNAVITLSKTHADTRVVWLVRSAGNTPYNRVENDILPSRDELAKLGNSIASGTHVTPVAQYINNSMIEKVTGGTDGKFEVELIRVVSNNEDNHDDDDEPQVVKGIDTIVSCCGFRPNLDMIRELQFHPCWKTEGPIKLAASLLADSGNSDCLAQTSPGIGQLLNPEPNFYILGNKSYGRSSRFILKVGVEQIDAVVAHLEGGAK